jgi:hypothetical protein
MSGPTFIEITQNSMQGNLAGSSGIETMIEELKKSGLFDV